jgi:hypothetical protein
MADSPAKQTQLKCYRLAETLLEPPTASDLIESDLATMHLFHTQMG